MPRPKVSIIFLCYNQEMFVEAALRSALDQAYPDFEVIVADDCSTDKTVEVIQSVLNQHERSSVVRMVPSASNLGIAKNWDRSIGYAQGEILIVMAGDDVSRLDRLDKVVSVFEAEPVAQAVVSQVRIIDRGGRIIRDEFESRNRRIGLLCRNPVMSGYAFWSDVPVIGASAAYRSRVVKNLGAIDHAASEDNASFYRALLMGGVWYLPEALVDWRWHGLNASIGAGHADEDPAASVARYAKRARAEYDACKQYRADAEKAYSIGLIGAKSYASELRRIELLESLLMLGWKSADPAQSFLSVFASALRHVMAERFRPKAFGYGLRSMLKAASPEKLRAIINRRSR
jgi:glycosyltransferase involved in cell wall biosynthesis